jgi:hypothetical protein
MTIMNASASTHIIFGVDLDTTKFEAFAQYVRDKYPIMDYYIDSSVVRNRIGMENIINIADGAYAHCEFEWSEYFYRVLLKKCVEVYGENSRESVICMNKLAVILSHNYQVNFVEIEYFLTTVGIYQITNIGKTPDTISTFFRLSHLYIATNNFVPVKKMLNYVMSIHTQVVGFDYVALNQILVAFGNRLFQVGKKPIANKCFQLAFEIKRTRGAPVDGILPEAIAEFSF